MNSLEQQILELESDLLKAEVRKSAQKISELLSKDFTEFTSSGSEYHYNDGDVFQEQNDNTIVYGEILDFKIKQLSDDCVLSMYKLIKYKEANENKKYTLRSSIWKRVDSGWKIIFHQGTISSKF